MKDPPETVADAVVDLCVALETYAAFLDPQGARARRDEAANETCWTLLLMMGTGCLNIPREERRWLASRAAVWSDLAHACQRIEEEHSSER